MAVIAIFNALRRYMAAGLTMGIGRTSDPPGNRLPDVAAIATFSIVRGSRATARTHARRRDMSDPYLKSGIFLAPFHNMTRTRRWRWSATSSCCSISTG